MTNYIYEEHLQSDRLVTRKLTENDITTWASFFEDKDATEFLFLSSLGLNSSFEFATHMIKKQLERYADKRFGHQALIDKKTKKFIGLCGLLTQKIDGNQEIEVGYHIFKEFWGQGYAPEAARIFIDYAFKNNLTPSIVSIIDLENKKSQRVAEKNGLTIDKQTKYLDNEDVYIYRIEKDRWK